MKSKTVKAVLRKKFDEFLASIEDSEVQKFVKNNSIITGGSIASMLMGEPVNDYDVYFTDKLTVLAVAKYYIEQFKYLNNAVTMEIIEKDGRVKLHIKSKGVAAEPDFKSEDDPNDPLPPDFHTERPQDEPEKPKYRPVFLSANAITLSDKMQLILRFYGPAKEIHSNYDFAHCTCYWVSKTSELVLPAVALECLLAKELRYLGSKYPLASIIRTRKFLLRGFNINAGQYLKMCLQLNDLNLRDLDILEDQLTGVDATYFMCLLEAIPENKKINNQVDALYLVTMIDRFF